MNHQPNTNLPNPDGFIEKVREWHQMTNGPYIEAEQLIEKQKPENPTTYFYELFAHMSQNHGMTLTDSEMDSICSAVDRVRGSRRAESQDEKQELKSCAHCGSNRVFDGTRGMNVAAKRVSCLNCGSSSSSLEVWNRRAERQDNSAEILNTVLYDVNYVGGLQYWIKKHHDLLVDLLAEKERLSKLVEALRRLEWAGADEHHNPACPVCQGSQWEDIGEPKFRMKNKREHKAQCWFQDLLQSLSLNTEEKK